MSELCEPADERELAAELPTPGIEVTPIDSLIGSAPMIVTINETYLPYDLSEADLRLRSIFPISTGPFCVRSRAAAWNPVPMWTEFELPADARVPDLKITGPVDCWLEDLIWKIDSWTAAGSPLWSYTQPRFLGKQLGRLAADGNRLARQATELIALHWPEPIAKPSASGRALLTRAGAISGPERDVRVAEAVSASSLLRR